MRDVPVDGRWPEWGAAAGARPRAQTRAGVRATLRSGVNATGSTAG